MISLLFKFFGDSTPLKQEAEKAKGEMKKAGGDIGKEFASQMKGAIMGAVGVGAIVSALKAGAAEVTKAATASATSGTGIGIKESLALERASKATGLSKEDILSQAQRTPESFGDFIKQYETPISETGLQNIARGSDQAKGMMTKVIDALMFSISDQFNRNIGAGKLVAGSLGLTGSSDTAGAGLSEMLTGVSRSTLASTPNERFMGGIGAEAARASAEEAFNKMVDNTNKMIEEQQKTRAAIERN